VADADVEGIEGSAVVAGQLGEASLTDVTGESRLHPSDLQVANILSVTPLLSEAKFGPQVIGIFMSPKIGSGGSIYCR
jgi:hypothetical protein